MTKLITYENQVELSNTDTQLLVTRITDDNDDLVDIHVEHDADTDFKYEADITFTPKEFKEFVRYLYWQYVDGLELSHEKIDLDAK